MRKKLFALAMALTMTVSLLAGCGSSSASGSSATSGSATSGSAASGSSAAVTANPDYPNSGTINCVIGWSAGGTTDLVARKVAALMSQDLNCNNNCTNVTGASGSIAAAQVQAVTDGETAWGGMISAIGTWRAMGYNDQDWSNWYSFISAQADYVLCVASNSDMNTYQDFIDKATANPGTLNAGNPGLGSVAHLAAVTLCNAFGVTTNHVPYSGGRAAAIGVMGGEIDYVFVAYGDVYDLIQSGDLKPLCWTGAADKTVTKTDGTDVTIPTIATSYPEVGKTIDLLAMWGVALPRTTPPEQVQAFKQEWESVMNSAEYKDYCDETGIKAVCIDGEDADMTMAESQSTYVELLEQLKLTSATAESLGIPSTADYSWDKVDMTSVNPWPAA